MRLAVFSTRSFDRAALTEANAGRHELTFFEASLVERTAPLATGYPGVCAFVNDRLDAACLERLKEGGTRLIVLRSAGFNHVDVERAEALGITVARVPAYSPHAVAEHTVALILAVVRHIPRASARVRDLNFSLEGLLGFDLNGRTVGVVGTGKIGAVVARILSGFGCRILAHDPAPSSDVAALGARYVPLDELFAAADIVTLHCPLTPATRHLVDARALSRMKRGAMLVNTSRGAIVDTRAAIDALKSGHLGHLALDVYEEEGDLFFKDLSDQVVQDDVFARLVTFPNVLITAHQAFFTREALANIAKTTIENASDFEEGTLPAERRVTPAMVAAAR